MKPSYSTPCCPRSESSYPHCNLFHNLPVRRRSIRKEAELSSIREYVQHMSVLHHSVHWSLSLQLPNSSSSSSSVVVGRSSQLHMTSLPRVSSSSSSCLLDLVAQGSVVDRLTSIHGRSIVGKLEVTSLTTVRYYVVLRECTLNYLPTYLPTYHCNAL